MEYVSKENLQSMIYTDDADKANHDDKRQSRQLPEIVILYLQTIISAVHLHDPAHLMQA
jgi:hypothetical protein